VTGWSVVSSGSGEVHDQRAREAFMFRGRPRDVGRRGLATVRMDSYRHALGCRAAGVSVRWHDP